MSLSPIKQEILKLMALNEKSRKAIDIAKEARMDFPHFLMNILGLIRMGYVSSPEKGLYIITARGKAVLNTLMLSNGNSVVAKEIIKETHVIVKIRCSYCRNLYDETYDKCPHCGGHY